MTAENRKPGTTPPDDGPTSASGGSRSNVVRNRVRKPVRAASRTLIDTAGPSPSSTLGDVRLTIGVIGGPHGVHGELKLKVLTDHPDHIPTLKVVYLGDSDEPTALLGARAHGDMMLIQLEGVSTPEEGRLLGGLKVRIAGSDAKPLEQGEYFLFQLIGLKASTPAGEPVGVVTDIIETGSHDVLVITPENGPDILVPNHPQFVQEIAPEDERIVLELPVYDS